METKFSFIDRFLGNRWLTHVTFWLVLLILQSQVFLYSGSSFKQILLFSGVMLPPIIMAAYLLVYYQVPVYLLKGKYLLFGLSFLVSAYVFTVLARSLTVFVAEPIIGIEDAFSNWEMFGRILTSPERLARNYLLSVYLAPCIMVVIKLVKQRSQERRLLQQLEKEKMTTELSFLKAQIHPHFLLNTLNNIYALTLKQSEKAPEMVLKLSEILTYVLYKCNEKYVPLTSEIQLIENYISLEKLRYAEGLQLSFEKEIQDEQSIMIAPLILLSIVENAFKHGASSDINTPEVRIQLGASKDHIQFEVYNTKSATKQSDDNQYTKGIGSKNVIKQLDLVYPNNYQFDVEEQKESYKVTLSIHQNKNNYAG